MNRDSSSPQSTPAPAPSFPPRPVATSSAGQQSDVLGALSQMETQFAALRQFHEQATKKQAELIALEARLTEQQQRAAEQLQRQAAEHERLRRDIEQQMQEIAQQRVALEAARSRLTIEEQESHERRSRLETDAARMREREQELQQQMTELRQAQDALEMEHARVADQRRELENRAAEASRSTDHTVESLNQTWSARVDELQRQLVSADASLAELREQKELVERGTSEATDQIEKMRLVIERLTAEAETLSRRADDAEQAARTAAESTITPEDIAKRDEAIRILKQRYDDAVRRAQELQRTLDAVSTNSTPASGVDDSMNAAIAKRLSRRRERLTTYKQLLQTQARKIVAAQSAIQKRQTECDQIISHRAKLANLATELARKEKRLAGGKARTGAFAAVMYMAITLGVLGVLSWEVTKRVWPATYIARTVVSVDPRGREPSEVDLANWQQFHTELLSDPRLMELAAERMKMRGLTTLGAAADLRDRLKSDMYVQSERPGTLTVELRGVGDARTALELETLITAFKSVSDATRGQRSEDLVATIAQAAAADPTPIKDDRLRWAASLLGGASLASLLIGAMVYSRLAKSRRKFEEDERQHELVGIDIPEPAMIARRKD